jgi:hypothetical protein
LSTSSEAVDRFRITEKMLDIVNHTHSLHLAWLGTFSVMEMETNYDLEVVEREKLRLIRVF